MALFPALLSSAELVFALEGDKIKLAFFTSIVSTGLMQYKYIIAVKPRGHKAPKYFINAEYTASSRLPNRYFLCEFENGEHTNYGNNLNWGDFGTFLNEALLMIKEKYGFQKDFIIIASPPEEWPLFDSCSVNTIANNYIGHRYDYNNVKEIILGSFSKSFQR
ncbi:MAG: hypothetical protein M0Q21_08895 [Ignavibacteriaceae bacterium]|nr:hypothetical protein [Ignavibacteriaceae bacterium]